jgi:hypothetical protein
MPRPPCLEAALGYLARGWAAVPLCPPDHAGCSAEHVAGCPRPGREPAVPWLAYRRRLPRPSELHLFWTRNPRCNVGVILGRVSRLVAVDVEGPEADDLLARVLPAVLPPTLTFRTPDGVRRHLFAIPPGLIIPRRRLDGPACYALVLGEGTPVVLPPSVHPNGATYSWNCPSPPPCLTGSSMPSEPRASARGACHQLSLTLRPLSAAAGRRRRR